MKIKTIENGIRLENDGKSLEITLVNEKWVTVHPNGKENKGRHLLIRDGESLEEAIERTYKEPSLFGKDTDLGKDPNSKSSRINYLTEKFKKILKEQADGNNPDSRIVGDVEEELQELIGKDAVEEIEGDFWENDDEEQKEAIRAGKYDVWKKIRDLQQKAKEEKLADKKDDAGDNKEAKEKGGYEIPQDYIDSVSKYTKEQHEKASDFYGEKMAKHARKANAGIGKDDGGAQYDANHALFEEYKALSEWHEAQAKNMSEQKEEQPKQEEKKTIDNIEDFVVSRSNGGYYASAKETRLYKNGNSTARVEELEGGSYAIDLKRNGVSLAHKYYTTKSGAEKALKEHLAGFEAKKLEKTNPDEKRQAYEDIKKAYDENHYKTWHANSDEERIEAYRKAEVAKKELTKARREYAESIMANFEEASENPYEERQQARKERYEELSGQAKERSDAIGKSASDTLSNIPFGEPIHSQADRNRREKLWSQFGKSYDEQQKAEHYAEKAKSVGTAGISSDDANAIAKLATKYNSGTIDSAEKRRIIDRVIDIDKRNRMLKQQAESGKKEDYSDLGFDVERNGNINRLQLKFSGIPSGDIRAKLKSHGFRWSPREGAWQRQLSTNAEWSFKRLVEELRKKGE